MKGLLVRVGVDHAYGGWNAPVDPDSGRFIYVPIPEKPGTRFHPGLARPFSEVLPFLARFCTEHGCDSQRDVRFPHALLGRHMHLDPDFDELTYGDDGDRRGSRMKELREGALVAFYAGLRPIRACQHRLIYALVGLYVVQKVVRAEEVPASRWSENAHTRKLQRGTADIVIRAKRGLSGRLNRCIPIGEWRNRAYRVRHDLLDAWGGISAKDGYIQRSAVPPSFLNPQRFYRWFLDQQTLFARGNN